MIILIAIIIVVAPIIIGAAVVGGGTDIGAGFMIGGCTFVLMVALVFVSAMRAREIAVNKIGNGDWTIELDETTIVSGDTTRTYKLNTE